MIKFYKKSTVQCTECLNEPNKLESFTIIFLTLLMLSVAIIFIYAIYNINTMIWN